MSKTLKFDLPKLGIQNVAVDNALARGAVLDAVNVDIADEGSFRSRASMQVFFAVQGIHTAYWSTLHEGVFYHRGNGVYFTRMDGVEAAIIPNGAGSASFAHHNDRVYIACPGTELVAVDENFNQYTPVTRHTGVAATALYTSARSLPPGTYTVAAAYRNTKTGEIGGTSPMSVVDVPPGFGILLHIPPLIPNTDYEHTFYCTDADGSILHECTTNMYDDTIVRPATGPTLTTTDIIPFPAGRDITWVGGRLFAVIEHTWSDNGWALMWSDHFRPMYTTAYNYISFTGRDHRFIARAGDWLFVGDDRGVWRVNGTDPAGTQLHQVSHKPALANSGMSVPANALPLPDLSNNTDMCAVWLTADGAVAGLPDGSMKPLHSQLQLDDATIVLNTSYILNDGIAQLLFVTDRDSLK